MPPRSRSAVTASAAPSQASSPTHRHPSRSSRTWSYGRMRGETATLRVYHRRPCSGPRADPAPRLRPARRRLRRRRLGPGEAAATATPAQERRAGCEPAEAPKPKGEGKLAKPKETLDPAKTYVATVKTNCGDFEITLDAKRAPKTGGSFKYAGRQGLLRRHDLPPHRAGLRDPGRRPEGRRHRRPRLLGRRGAAEGPRVRQGRRGDGQDRRRAVRHVRQPVLRRHRRGRRAAARLRAARARSPPARTWSTRSASPRPTRRPRSRSTPS